MWFAGAHSDVGGGYPESEWSDVALKWMASEAWDYGLRLRDRPNTAGLELPDTMIHNSIRRWFALSRPGLRAPLSDPRSVCPETRSTFDVHAVAVERLFVEKLTKYGFVRSCVNESLRSVDASTLRMLGLIGVVDPSPERITAITEFWSDEAWSSASCREDLTAFVNAGGRPTGADGNAFIRALFAQLICGRDPLPGLLAAIGEAVTRVLVDLPQAEDSTSIKDLDARLREIYSRVRDAIPVLPDAFAPQVESFLAEAAREHGKLHTVTWEKITPPKILLRRGGN